MIRSRLFAMITMGFFLLGVGTLGSAAAGEKTKYHGAGVVVKFEQMKVGDEEGHVIGIYEQKQVYKNETTGELFHSVSIGFMDINPKKMQFSNRGYGVSFYKDGSKSFRSYEGKPIGKGHWRGIWTVTGGTDEQEGIKGGGTWESYSVGPQESYIEVEGDIEKPAK